jgi:hypothetical protein
MAGGQALPRGEVSVQGGTRTRGCGHGQRQLKLLQWAILALTGAVLVVNARMGEQQRPAQVSGGLLGPLPTRTGRLTKADATGMVSGAPESGWLSAAGRFHH